MDVGKILQYLVERSRTLSWIMLAIMAGLVVADFLAPSHYDRFFWESVPGFGAIYGFVACVVIIIVSKALGYALLYRPEDYYDD